MRCHVLNYLFSFYRWNNFVGLNNIISFTYYGNTCKNDAFISLIVKVKLVV